MALRLPRSAFCIYPKTHTTIKHKGSISEFKGERERELLAAYKVQLSKRHHKRLDYSFWEAVAKTPASRFWVSADRAIVIIKKLLKGEDVPTKIENNRMMFEDLFQVVLKEKKKKPDDKLALLVERAIRTPAPQMYITPNSAKIIISRIRRRIRTTGLQHSRPF